MCVKLRKTVLELLIQPIVLFHKAKNGTEKKNICVYLKGVCLELEECAVGGFFGSYVHCAHRI